MWTEANVRTDITQVVLQTIIVDCNRLSTVVQEENGECSDYARG
jgi:hypothetical protein